MSTLHSQRVQTLLQRLHSAARAADRPLMAKIQQLPGPERAALFNDYKRLYSLAQDAFLPVGEEFGRMLYLLARTQTAHTIVEFGTSFGLSTVYLASALRDNGGGRLITCELQPAKSKRARSHLEEAGLADLVDFRVGDALEVFRQEMPSGVDMVLLDGAKPLYYQVLKLLEPCLRPGTLVASDNINEHQNVSEFTTYVRRPQNGYLSVEMPLEDGIELSLRL